MSAQLQFECPHCAGVVGVARDLLGKAVRCPHCDREFTARSPVGRPVQAADVAPGRNADNEQTLREFHPVVFRNQIGRTLLFALVGLIGLAAALLGLLDRTALGLEGTALFAAGGASLFVALGYVCYQWLHAIAMRITVTTERIIVTQGILTKRTNELQHDDVRNIRCDQNVLERLFNYGDLALSSSGQDDMEIVIHDIPDPQGIVEIVRRCQ